jgi:hypothetical protein
MRERFGKGLLGAGRAAWATTDELHLRYAAANAPFGRLCFPNSPQSRSLASKRRAGMGDAQ